MTPRQFAKIATSFPGVEEAEHMGHPDFRFGGIGKTEDREIGFGVSL